MSDPGAMVRQPSNAPAPAPAPETGVPHALRSRTPRRLPTLLRLRRPGRRRVTKFPRGRRHLADQLSRAATSIILNIAEGAGKFSGPDKQRFYTTAIGSAT